MVVPVSYTHLDVYKRQGYIKASPDGKKLALSSVQSPVLGSFIALHDFDVNTGKVSNGIIIDNINYDLLNAYFYALEFSPNSSKLFVNMRIPVSYTHLDVYKRQISTTNTERGMGR